MTLRRYQIRNEYGLANKELYQAANTENPEAFFEAASMAGLVGVLRQLGDLAEFAAEVFHCLHQELVTTTARGHDLGMRLQHLEAELPSVEIAILSQTHHSTFFYDPGLEWHSALQTKQDMISLRNLPHFIMDSYEECRGPPQLFLLDKFDVDGSGSCLKRYSDPSLCTISAIVATSKLSKDEIPRQSKNKGSHTTSKETPGDSRTSHAKLLQLFFLEHVENGHMTPEFHVKLKRRQLNGHPINSSSGTSYMERFLKNSSPYCERVYGTLDQSSPTKETEVTVCSVQEDLPIPSLVYPNSGDSRKYNEMEIEATDDGERLHIPFVPHEVTINDKSLTNIEGGPTTCLERNSYLNLCCKANNDTDAPPSTELEAKEADSEDSAGCNHGFAGFGQTQIETHLTKLTQDGPEGGTNVLLTNYVEDDRSRHVSIVETASEISLSGLVEDQLASITKQEIEAVEPDDISSEKTPSALEFVKLLPNQYISSFDIFEDISPAANAQENSVPKEDETNSRDGSHRNAEQSVHISTSDISSENGSMISNTPRDLHTGYDNLSTSFCRKDVLANQDLVEISSYSGQETMLSIADDSTEPEVPIPDTQRHDTCLAADVVQDNQTGLNNKAIETMPELDLETNRDAHGSLLGTHDQGQESSSETGSANPTTTSAEFLPIQDEHISESVHSMELIDEEYCFDVSAKPMVPFSTPLHETPQADVEISPPLPPLPPTQWWMGKLVESTEMQSLAGSPNNSFYIHMDVNTQNGSVQVTETHYPSEAAVTYGENHTEGSRVEAVSSCAQSTLNEPSKATEEQSLPAVNGTRDDSFMHNNESSILKSLNKTVEASFAEERSAGGLDTDWRTEALALEWFSQNLREHTITQLDHLLEPPGAIVFPQTLRDSSYDMNQETGNLKRDMDSLVIGIDRSMLRKASERHRTQVGARVDEHDSLLKIIRSKSFNLRPTDALGRPNFQVAVPKTNLKVAAILEKANALRQAMAGSDDEHDSDSWSE